MAKLIVSFGFRHGIPTLSEKDRVMDVRRYLTKNPFHDKALRQLRGDNEEVARDIENAPDFEKSYKHIKVQVSKALERGGDVYLGCTGGHHRSVYLADRLGKELGVEVIHLNYNDK